MLPNIIKNQFNCTISLTEWGSKSFIYIYALKHINARYGSKYTIISSNSDELKKQIDLFNFGPIHI